MAKAATPKEPKEKPLFTMHGGDEIIEAIDRGIVAAARSGNSLGISMSETTVECDRSLFYSLRWTSPPESITGKKQRVFDVGNAFETMIVDYLKLGGINIQERDPETGKQFEARLAGGYLRGKLDGIATNVPTAPVAQHVVEIKSVSDKDYKALVAKGLKEAKYAHYLQTILYIHAKGLQRGMYVALNKNTQELYVERVEADTVLALATEGRIERIVGATDAPARVSEDPESYACKAFGSYCKHHATCHLGAWAKRNCRTCIFSMPTGSDGLWTCTKHQIAALTYDQTAKGCEDHRYLPALVNGVQIDVDDASGAIIYEMADGSDFMDGQVIPQEAA